MPTVQCVSIAQARSVYYIDNEDCEQTNDEEKGDAEKIEGAGTGEPEIEGAEMGQGNAPLAAEDLKDRVCFYSTVYIAVPCTYMFTYAAGKLGFWS